MIFQILISQLLQIAIASASPLAASSNPNVGKQIGFGTGGGILGLILLVLHIIVFAEVLNSNRPVPNKVLWCLLIFLFPIGGVIIYALFSNRALHNNNGAGYEPIP